MRAADVPIIRNVGLDGMLVSFGDRLSEPANRAALDKHYGQLKMEGDDRRKLQFNDRMEVLKSSPDGQFQIEKESRFIKRKIEELEGERRSMENSMGMFNFKSASGEAMKADMEKKIERLNRDVDRLKGQHKELLKELK